MIRGCTGSLMAGTGAALAVISVTLFFTGRAVRQCSGEFDAMRKRIQRGNAVCVGYTALLCKLEEANGPYWNHGCTLHECGSNLEVRSFAGEPVLFIKKDRTGMSLIIPLKDSEVMLPVTSWKLVPGPYGRMCLRVRFPYGNIEGEMEIFIISKERKR